jgi:hypothetical protein
VDSGDGPGLGLTFSISWARVANLVASMWQLTHSLSALPLLYTCRGDMWHAGRAKNKTRNPVAERAAFIRFKYLPYSYPLAMPEYFNCRQSGMHSPQWRFNLLVFL